jgi:ABC-type antimicrobial peptide transport system permease subunit
VFDRSLAEPPVPRYFQLLGNVYTYAPSGRVNYAFRIDGIAPPREAIRRVVGATDTQAVVESVDSVDGRLAEGIRDRTFATLVLGLFGVAGLGVTASGMFAIVAFVVARRTQEIGIRVALGARAHQVRWLVLRDALVAGVVGATIGFLVARMLAKFLASYLYGLEASDWSTPLAAAAVMAIVTGMSAWWPTRRALRLQPTLALRVE